MLNQISAKHLITEKEIGKGGYGIVYTGKWHKTPVAIKKLLLTNPSESALAEFKKEAEIMAQCQHPNVVRFYGACLEPGEYALVMDYVSKGSLYHVLHNPQEKLPWSQGWPLAEEIGLGLHYLHEQKIIHRDFKSLNVLLDKDYHPKITDFGLSKVKLETSTSSTKGVTASIRWQAPELFQPDGHSTQASDIYSYGMVLWEIASRKLPFEKAPNEMIAMSWILQGTKEKIPEGTPKAYEELIQQCWQTAEKRPSAYEITLFFEKHKPQSNDTGKEKSWHYDRNYSPPKGEYFVDASDQDKKKVASLYQKYPVPKHDIKSIKVLINPNLNRQFDLRIKLLQEKKGNKVHEPQWPKEKNPHREKVHQLSEDLSKSYQDPEYPDVKIIPAWHGTSSEAINGIAQTGYASLGTTDGGFFGKGYYFTPHSEYAHRVYSKGSNGALLLNWVCYYSAYPVTNEDMPKLMGKNHYENYDAHFVPIVATSYFACSSEQNYDYIELVLFESAQCLPRYLVEVQPALPKEITFINPSKQSQPKPTSPPVKNIPSKTENNNDPQPSAPSPDPKPLIIIEPSPVKDKNLGEDEFEVGYQHYLKSEYTFSLISFSEAAKYPYPPAFLYLYRLHEVSGRIGPRNQLESSKWFEKAKLHFNWFKKEAKTKKAVDQFHLGFCYQEGIGVELNLKKAFKWTEKAALQGEPQAQDHLGWYYKEGKVVDQNYEKAIDYFKKAAAYPLASASCNLGICYEKGEGVAQDIKEAINFYKKAALQGDPIAQCNLGVIYYHGQAIPRDLKQAVEWFEKAANQGHMTAQYNLGLCYKNGEGVTKNKKEAVKWFEKAANQGLEKAQQKLTKYSLGEKNSFFSQISKKEEDTDKSLLPKKK